jgi:hypothetical protein
LSFLRAKRVKKKKKKKMSSEEITALEDYIDAYGEIPEICMQFNGISVGSVFLKLKKEPLKYKLSILHLRLLKEFNILIRMSQTERKFLWIRVLNSYVKKYNDVPKFSCKYKGYNIGQRFSYMKRHPNSWINYFTNEIILINLRIGKKRMDKMIWVNLITEYVELNNELPNRYVIYKNKKIGYKLYDMKKKYKNWHNLFKNKLILDYLTRKSLTTLKREKWISDFENFVRLNNRLPLSNPEEEYLSLKWIKIQQNKHIWRPLFKNPLILNLL